MKTPTQNVPIAGREYLRDTDTASPRLINVAPEQGESQAEFFDRANIALEKSVPSQNRRTVHILELWSASPNADDRELRLTAAAHFPQDKFQHFQPRCIFPEHTVPASADGSRPEIVYDRDALQKLIDYANYRIENASTFSAISDDHTPSRDERLAGAKNPDVLGYAGPFYLGMFGDKDPKYAVYADEWAHLSDLQRFEKLQRRSPEVWTCEPMESRTMDPIAALGSATPRLDSGMNPYCRASDDRMVMKYSAVAFPGPTNTFVPTAGKAPKKPDPTKYAANGDSGMVLDKDRQQGDIDAGMAEKIGEALTALMPSIVNAIVEQLSGVDGEIDGDSDLPEEGDAANVETEPGDDGQKSDAGTEYNVADTGEQAADAGDESNQAETPESVPDLTPRGMEQPNAADTSNDTDRASGQQQNANPKGSQTMNTNAGGAAAPAQEDDERKYAAMGGDVYAAYCSGKRKGLMASTTQYSRQGGEPVADTAIVATLQKTVARQQNELNTLRDRIATKERDIMRYSRLNGLSRDFAFNTDDEMTTCLGMNDDQFERHCTVTVAKYAKRNELEGAELYNDANLDRGQKKGTHITEKDVEKYSKQAATETAHRVAKGEKVTYDQVFYETLTKAGVAVEGYQAA